MTKPAYVILTLPGESSETTHAHFTIRYGDERTAELQLFGLPLVPEGEHAETKLPIYELLDALNAWRAAGGLIHPSSS